MIRTVGVVGGGQLGRYFVREAHALGYRTVLLDPDPQSPGAQMCDIHICGEFTDLELVTKFCNLCDEVTVEFENIPATTLELIETLVPLRPSARAVTTAADRRKEKLFLTSCGLSVAPFFVVDSIADVDRAMSQTPQSSVSSTPQYLVKTATHGYDGKGQLKLSGLHELRDAWTSLGEVPCVVEQVVEFDAEMSIIVARSSKNIVVSYTPTVNTHVNGVLDHSVTLSNEQLEELGSRAQRIGETIVQELDYVGVLGVELFVVGTELLVNEFAPRPHNSGHWTLDGATTSQFGQQLRCLVDQPLGDCKQLFGGVAMANLLGDLWTSGEPLWSSLSNDPRITVHMYGKKNPRPGRKMGHITAVAETPHEALQLVLEARSALSGNS
jgi:5-(carboxyamino)imidazole ribonucleotide synthase